MLYVRKGPRRREFKAVRVLEDLHGVGNNYSLVYIDFMAFWICKDKGRKRPSKDFFGILRELRDVWFEGKQSVYDSMMVFATRKYVDTRKAYHTEIDEGG